MENSITIFNSPQFGTIRTAGTAEKPMFCATDVARALQYSNPAKAIIDHCKGVTVLETPTKGGKQMMKYITESDMYRLIFKSNAPKAEDFNSWVANEVLPTIRKTGGYIAASSTMSDAEIMAKAVLVAQTTIENRNARIKQLEEENAGQKQLIAQMQKGNDYLNTILQSKGTLATTQVAADYGMSAIAFNRKLKEMHIQHKVNGQWILYSEFMGKGYVHSRTISFVHSDGRPDTKLCTEWCQRGRLFLYDALKEVGILPMIERKDIFQA